VLDPHTLGVTLPALEEIRIGPLRLFSTIARTRDRTAAARGPHFEAFARPLADQRLTLDRDGERLRPRLVTKEWLAAAPPDPPVIHRSLDQTGLHVVYVLDSPKTVTFVTERQREQLGLIPEALHERALANLSASLGREVVRTTLASSTATVIRTGDSHDAARLLLIPAALDDGEELAACVPDRDTLVVTSVPDSGDWESLLLLTRQPGGPPLLQRPLRVTRQGFELR
jgi:hypothetical protein